MYKPSKTVSIEKAEPRWEDGLWLGIIPETHEHIIGTCRGVVKCRAIAAMEESKKFDRKMVEDMQGLPWQPIPGRKTNRIPTHIRTSENPKKRKTRLLTPKMKDNSRFKSKPKKMKIQKDR